MTVVTPIETARRRAHADRPAGAPAPMVRLGTLSVGAWSSPSLEETEAQPAGSSRPRGWPDVPVCGDVAAVVSAGGRLRVLVADVAGHGHEAAPLAASLHSAFTDLAGGAGDDLTALAATLDMLVALRGTAEAYVTACFLDLHPDGMVAVANCGHPWPLATDAAGRWRKLPPSRPSLPLGVGAAPVLDVHRLGPGSRLVVYTDGIAISRPGHPDLHNLKAVVNGVLETGPPPPRLRHDDATVVVGQWRSHRRRGLGRANHPAMPTTSASRILLGATSRTLLRPGGKEPDVATTLNGEAQPMAAGPFVASERLAGDLQRVLVDLIALHLQGKQAHWNVVGYNFRDLHLQLDEIVDDAREASDTIAERMRALDAVPDGRAPTVAATAALTPLPSGELSTAQAVDLVTDSLHVAVHTMRDVHDEVDAEDPATSDLLHVIIDQLEKHAWMLSAENRIL